MEIIRHQEENELTIMIIGRLDTLTTPELEADLEDISGITSLIMDFEQLDYISSAGLRLLLNLQKTMNKQGKLTIKNVKEAVLEVFEITGFVDVLTIE